MLENLGHRGKLRLLDIINLSWKIGRLPSEWKRAIIIPIKKAGKNNWSPKDFRPIALTSTTCKIMEKMILIRIQYFLDSKNLIPGEQYGYRRGHSTVDQIISFCQSIRYAQNCKPTHHTMAALLDLTKAFDRVWKHKLLIKLHDTFNIRGNTLAWISDFLHHRYMRWIPSHVDIFGNEQADRLAREGCSLLTTSSPAITSQSTSPKLIGNYLRSGRFPSHHWYAARESGSFLDLNCDSASKTAISRLASGHTKSLSFFEGRKTFKFCSMQGSAGLCRTYPGLSGSFQRRLVRFSPSCYRFFEGQQFNGSCLTSSDN
ncbi:probable RNA-directed DNA polymerase from transposon X-element [Trichonephila clavipes]|nr:probable RNA-directed DNA polymerase from transposon X-element [Trichonephila clavipes]